MRLTTIILALSLPALGACAAVQSPIGPSVDTPTRQTPAVQVDVVEADVVTEATEPAAATTTVPFTCEFHEDACFYPTPPPPAEPGWVYRDCAEQGLTSTPTGCGEAIGDAPPGTPIYD